MLIRINFELTVRSTSRVPVRILFEFSIRARLRNHLYILDHRHGRRGSLKFAGEPVQRSGSPFQAALQPGGGVAYPSQYMVLLRQAVKEGTEPHALDDPFYIDMDAGNIVMNADSGKSVVLPDGRTLPFSLLCAPAVHDRLFPAFSVMKSARSRIPSPLRLLTRKRGASGLTVP